MLAEFSSLQHCRQSRNAEADVRSDFQEKLFRNNFSLIRFSCCWLFQQLSIIWFSKIVGNCSDCWGLSSFSYGEQSISIRKLSNIIPHKIPIWTAFVVGGQFNYYFFWISYSALPSVCPLIVFTEVNYTCYKNADGSVHFEFGFKNIYIRRRAKRLRCIKSSTAYFPGNNAVSLKICF